MVEEHYLRSDEETILKEVAGPNVDVLYSHLYSNRHTLSLDTPINPLSLVSMFVQERNSIPKSSKEDHNLMNQHLASATVTSSREECSAIICLATALILHFGGAMTPLIVLIKSGLYLDKGYTGSFKYPAICSIAWFHDNSGINE